MKIAQQQIFCQKKEKKKWKINCTMKMLAHFRGQPLILNERLNKKKSLQNAAEVKNIFK